MEVSGGENELEYIWGSSFFFFLKRESIEVISNSLCTHYEFISVDILNFYYLR